MKWWQYGTEILKGIPARIDDAVKVLEERVQYQDLFNPSKFIFDGVSNQVCRQNGESIELYKYN